MESTTYLKTAAELRTSGRYKIPFVKVGRLVRYRRADLDAWLTSRTVNADALEGARK
jgi:hypothetical protein